MYIREATRQDRNDIQSIYRSAFDEDEREIVSNLALSLLTKDASPSIMSLVAETEGTVVGHLAFSPVATDNNENFQGYILAPLAVKPVYQKRGIGTKLVKRGIQQLSKMKVDIIFVYGDPEYYSRFCFSVEAAERYIPPHKLQYPFGWQGIAVSDKNIGKLPVHITCVASLNDPVLW